ncbi:alpha-mannosidase [Candidatus Bipolaricaulota bacterium]|nr:alpha-mannosidase [Candidatus Bipolaricaulota bacterium]
MEVTKNKRANHTEKKLKDLIFSQPKEIEDLSYHISQDFLKPEEVRKKDFTPCEPGFSWKRERRRVDRSELNGEIDINNSAQLPQELSLGNNAWFKLIFEIPKDFSRNNTALRFSVRGASASKMSPIEGRPAAEAQCYANGSPLQSFDHGHELLRLADVPSEGGKFDLLIEVGTTFLWGGLDIDEFILEKAEIAEIREEIRKLYFEYKSFNDLRKKLPEKSPLGKKILNRLTEASHIFPFSEGSTSQLASGSKEAQEVLSPLKDFKSEFSDFKLTAVGHAHLDSAWLWPWSETVRKAGRTFSSALKLTEEYPDFRFLQSQPHLYEFVRQRYPEIFKKIKEKVKSGNWETVGGTWIECDVNISGGEALARQYLYGKRYFREEFDVDPKITFIPDVFGYSASLPGIAKAADCPYFFTQKMSWSEVNEFPHHSFVWEGIDGSQIIAHFPPADTYNGMTFDDPVNEVVKSARDYKEKDQLNRAAYLIGWGDGGGGANRDMVEQADSINEIDALPDLEFGQLKDFFSELENNRDKLEKWVGELYLERHRGTLTTQGVTKRNNRKLEFALREAEIWSSIALLGDNDFDYPKEELDSTWKTLLFHQFHDVLPGSSIGEVYEDADRDYGKAFETVETIISEARHELVGDLETADKCFVYNSLPWRMDRLAKTELPDFEGGKITAVDSEGNRYPTQSSGKNDDAVVFNAAGLPALGGKTFRFEPGTNDVHNELKISENRLENSLIRVTLGKDGMISTLLDKSADREVLESPGNRFGLYRDLPTEFDAWEIEGDIYEVSKDLPPPTTTKVIENGPVRGILRQERTFGDSKITQDLIIYRGSKRLDFETSVDWHEKDNLLKVHFPIAVRSNEATYEIQYGHYRRPTHSNTSWDEARFEVPHQKWVDVAEHNYGAALLNDCKYGVNVDGTEIGLSLLRGPSSPDPESDMGPHQFTYSLLPHQGDFRETGVIKQSYELNTSPGTNPSEDMMELEPLVKVEDDGVVIEAIKRSEVSPNALVIRAYESWGRRVSTDLHFGFDSKSVKETNIIEDELTDLELKENQVRLDFSPFEIKTLKVFYE